MEFHKTFLGVVPLDLLDTVVHTALLQTLFSLDLCGPEIPVFLSPLWPYLFLIRRTSSAVVLELLWSSRGINSCHPYLPRDRDSSPPLPDWKSQRSRSYFSSSHFLYPVAHGVPIFALKKLLALTAFSTQNPSTQSTVPQTVSITRINKICTIHSSSFWLFMYYVLY